MFREPWKDPRIRSFTNARFELIPEASHQIHHDAPDDFERIVRRFLFDPAVAERRTLRPDRDPAAARR
jgi:pimeloyl-ACP methyl ester carboxylesterase